MKICLRTLLFLPLLLAGFAWMPVDRVAAQTFTTLYSFTTQFPNDPPFLNGDGAHPVAGVVLVGDTLYGTTPEGGSSGYGVMFAVKTNGTGITNLHTFTSPGNPNFAPNGLIPKSGLILAAGTLYGTAETGGTSGAGTVFAVNTDGTAFSTLHSLEADHDGGWPNAELVLAGNTLYGTASSGGKEGAGTVFAVRTDGTGFTTLHDFTDINNDAHTNSDGAWPLTGLALSGDTLYGTMYSGGNSGNGTVFAVNTNGTGFTTLHTFAAGATNLSNAYTNSGGATPKGKLIISGNTLYGTTARGGSWGSGTVFAVNTDGTSFRALYAFTALSPYPNRTNSDGGFPYGGLVLSGGTLYGAANSGGSSNKGTVFSLNTDGTGFSVLHSFSATGSEPPQTNSDGANPMGDLILSGDTLYGTAYYGGSSGSGTVFSISLPSVAAPQLTINANVATVVLTWPSDAAGFALQTAPDLPPAAVWSPVSPAPVIINGQNTVTNVISDTRHFYRLSQ